MADASKPQIFSSFPTNILPLGKQLAGGLEFVERIAFLGFTAVRFAYSFSGFFVSVGDRV